MRFLFFEIGRSVPIIALPRFHRFFYTAHWQIDFDKIDSSTVHSLLSRRNTAIVIKHLTEHVALSSTCVDLSCLIVARFEVGLSFMTFMYASQRTERTRDVPRLSPGAGVYCSQHYAYCREFDIKLTTIYT